MGCLGLGLHARRSQGGGADVRAEALGELAARVILGRRGIHARLPRRGGADVRAADAPPALMRAVLQVDDLLLWRRCSLARARERHRPSPLAPLVFCTGCGCKWSQFRDVSMPASVVFTSTIAIAIPGAPVLPIARAARVAGATDLSTTILKLRKFRHGAMRVFM